eukprot:SAG31_NODE_2996_length_4803_cov_8.948342_6_plen_69_part_00
MKLGRHFGRKSCITVASGWQWRTSRSWDTVILERARYGRTYDKNLCLREKVNPYLDLLAWPRAKLEAS